MENDQRISKEYVPHYICHISSISEPTIYMRKIYISCVIRRWRGSSLAADLGQHLVDGLFDVRGGAAASGLALHGLAAPHLAAQLMEGLGDGAALVGARRTFVESARHFGRQALPFLCADLPDVVQIGLVAHEDEGHVFGLLHLL